MYIILSVIPGFFMARAYNQNDLYGILVYGFCYLSFMLLAIRDEIKDKKG